MENKESNLEEPDKTSKKKKLKDLFALKHIIGIVAGGVAGFFYYYFVGCASGACALKSNPYYNIILGILLGYLVADLFKKKKTNNPQ